MDRMFHLLSDTLDGLMLLPLCQLDPGPSSASFSSNDTDWSDQNCDRLKTTQTAAFQDGSTRSPTAARSLLMSILSCVLKLLRVLRCVLQQTGGSFGRASDGDCGCPTRRSAPSKSRPPPGWGETWRSRLKLRETEDRELKQQGCIGLPTVFYFEQVTKIHPSSNYYLSL